MTDTQEKCEHEGIECDPQLICAVGCCCGHCLEAIDTDLSITGDTSDGHYTFDDLYMHRMALTLALAHSGPGHAWRTKLHHPDDSPMFEGMFLVGIELPIGAGQILYHYKLQYWDLFDGILERRHAPKWDGAGPDVTVERLVNWRKGWKVY